MIYQFMMEEWLVGGRFFVKDYLDLDYFFCVFIVVFIVCVIFEKILEYEKVFFQLFQSCIIKDEEDVVDEFFKENFDVDELIDVFNRFDCRKVLIKKKFESLFLK